MQCFVVPAVFAVPALWRLLGAAQRSSMSMCSGLCLLGWLRALGWLILRLCFHKGIGLLDFAVFGVTRPAARGWVAFMPFRVSVDGSSSVQRLTAPCHPHTSSSFCSTLLLPGSLLNLTALPSYSFLAFVCSSISFSGLASLSAFPPCRLYSCTPHSLPIAVGAASAALCCAALPGWVDKQHFSALLLPRGPGGEYGGCHTLPLLPNDV